MVYDQKETEKRETFVLGITGGVGAGKSTVLSWLKEKHGAFILEADAVAHQLQQPGEACYDRIVEAFGDEIRTPDQGIDRGLLGAIVYADREKLELLNGIVHPAVKTFIRGKIAKEKGKSSLIVIEAALLIEDHYEELCDEMWYIYADVPTRTKRLMTSRGYSPEKIRQIMNNQLSEEVFRSRCAAVIDNSDSDLSRTQAQIDQTLKKRFYN